MNAYDYEHKSNWTPTRSNILSYTAGSDGSLQWNIHMNVPHSHVGLNPARTIPPILNSTRTKYTSPNPRRIITAGHDHTGQWASYQIRKIAGCSCVGNAGNVFPTRQLQRKPLVSDPDIHHGTCVTHVPWCMSGSLTCGGGKNVPGIPGACAPTIIRIWQEAHVRQS